MSYVNPYEPSQLRETALADVASSPDSSELEQHVFGARGSWIVLGTRYWLVGLIVHHAFALTGYGLYWVDWSLGERTPYRHLGFAVLLIGIVISLFIQAAGHLRLCGWPSNNAARWWFRAAFVCFVGVMMLSIGDLMLMLKYRENRDPTLGQLIDIEQPTLIVTRVVLNMLLTLGIYHIGRLLQDRRLCQFALAAMAGGLLLGAAEYHLELLGSITQVLREVTYLEFPELLLVIFAWLLFTVSAVLAVFQLWQTAGRVAAVTIPVAIDDPLAD